MLLLEVLLMRSINFYVHLVIKYLIELVAAIVVVAVLPKLMGVHLVLHELVPAPTAVRLHVAHLHAVLVAVEVRHVADLPLLLSLLLIIWLLVLILILVAVRGPHLLLVHVRAKASTLPDATIQVVHVGLEIVDGRLGEQFGILHEWLLIHVVALVEGPSILSAAHLLQGRLVEATHVLSLLLLLILIHLLLFLELMLFLLLDVDFVIMLLLLAIVLLKLLLLLLLHVFLLAPTELFTELPSSRLELRLLQFLLLNHLLLLLGNPLRIGLHGLGRLELAQLLGLVRVLMPCSFHPHIRRLLSHEVIVKRVEAYPHLLPCIDVRVIIKFTYLIV